MRRSVRIFFALTVCALLLGSLLPQPVLKVANAQRRRRADEPVVARVTVRSRAELDRLVSLQLDLLETREGDDLFILTTAEQVRKLRRQGWQISVDKQQSALLRQRPDLKSTRAKTAQRDDAAATTAGVGYLTVPEMRAFLDERAAQHPALAEVFVYGNSWERLNKGTAFGHELFGVRLTNRQRTGPKPTFFLMAAIHARELSTSELALRFVDHLLAGYGVDADATWLLDEHQIVVVPVVNPDGRRLAEQGLYQRKNVNTANGAGCADPPTVTNQAGVDLNRNYDFKWGTVDAPGGDPCAQAYPGASAASEPETAALQDLVRSLFADRRGPLDTDAAPAETSGVVITLHSYGELVMWPWGHTAAGAPNGAELSLIGQKFAGYNGYTPQQSNQLYPSSGKTDEWAYGELGVASYVFEVGLSSGECGGFMPPYSCLDGGAGGSFWPRNLPTFLYAARIAREPYRLAQGPSPESLVAIPAGQNTFELRARLDEQRNGGQRIVAAEYYIDTPPWQGGTPFPMTPADGNFDGATEVAVATVAPPPGGPHTLFVRGRDEQGNWGPVRAAFRPDGSCAYAISPSAQSYAAAGGAGVISVTAGTNCGWAATVNGGASWVALTSNDTGTGTGTVNFTVAANGGASPRTATITVAGQTFTVTEGALRLDTLTLGPASVTGGQSSVGTVTLNSPAPAGGVVVTLASSNQVVAAVPATVTVAAGATSQTFDAATFAVANASAVNISAAYAGVTRTAALTVTPAAAAPTDLTATPGSSKVDLKWADKSNNESGFRVERCEGTTCTNFAQVATVGANVTTYRNTSLGSRRTYRYRVRAYTSVGSSVYSNIAAAQTR